MPRHAAIDIGTNTVLLTVADYDAAAGWTVRHDEAVITRMGEGMAASPLFCAAAMDRTAALLARYAATCAQFGVTPIAVGTAAFRRAQNAHAFIDRIARECGITIDVISGDDEAALSFAAAAHDFGNDALVLDIGGGSTELVWRGEGMLGQSLPLGAVSLHERFVRSDPITASDIAQITQAIVQALDTITLPRDLPHFRTQHPRLVALAGTATTLGAMHLQLVTYQHAQVHGLELSRAQIDTIVAALAGASVAERRQMPGLEAARADVIYTGSLLLTAVMHRWGYTHVTISDRGVRWGLLYRTQNTPLP